MWLVSSRDENGASFKNSYISTDFDDTEDNVL